MTVCPSGTPNVCFPAVPETILFLLFLALPSPLPSPGGSWGQGPDGHLPSTIGGFGPVPARISVDVFVLFVFALSALGPCAPVSH